MHRRAAVRISVGPGRARPLRRHRRAIRRTCRRCARRGPAAR